MYLVLGNLTVSEFARRVETAFTAEEITTLESFRTNSAQEIGAGEFHIFADPAIQIHIGTEALAATLPLWTAANNRKPFNGEVNFYPARNSKKAD